MGQKVTLKVAGKAYSLDAPSPEVEQLMRLAAEEVNMMLDDFSMRFPEASMEDKFAFIAVQEAVAGKSAELEIKSLKDDASALNSELISYLSEKYK